MNKVQELEMKVNRICEMKNHIDDLKENIELYKVSLIKDMAELQVDRVEAQDGVALIMDYERGTLNGELVETGLEKSKYHEVTVDDCKTYTHLNFLLIKRNKEK